MKPPISPPVNKPVESGDELPDAIEMNKTLDIADPAQVRMDIDDTELDNNNNTSSSKMGKSFVHCRRRRRLFLSLSLCPSKQ